MTDTYTNSGSNELMIFRNQRFSGIVDFLKYGIFWNQSFLGIIDFCLSKRL